MRHIALWNKHSRYLLGATRSDFPARPLLFMEMGFHGLDRSSSTSTMSYVVTVESRLQWMDGLSHGSFDLRMKSDWGTS